MSLVYDFKRNKKYYCIFLLVLLVGIFLRTYNFHNWLRFSGDQARDAGIISAALEHRATLPLLGPNAGNTQFLLGPMYYYLSYVSTLLFGNRPDAMALPSLISSILAIPLSFLFLREYFDKKISLMLMAIMSVSYFMVINSRFSSNPNLIPFFLMLYLYALLKLLNNNKVFSYKWAIVAGIGLGVGIQLHTTLFVSMPIMGLLVFAQLIKNKAAGTWKSFFVILGLVLALNVTQIISEVNTNWQNSKNFISGLHSDSKNNFGKDLVLITSCQIQANSFVLTSLQDDDRCQPIYQLPHGNSTRGFIYCLGMVLNILFSFVGYFLLFHFYKKETDTKKKNFLLLVAVVNVVSLAILLPVSGIMYLGYFLFLFYIPLILLGLMFKFLFEKFKQLGYAVVIFSMVILLALSLKRDHQVAIRYMDGSEDNYKNSTLGEVERMSSYMLSSAKNHPEIYIDGQKNITRRFYEPIKYFLRESGIGTTMAKQDKPVPPGMPLYYIDKKNSKTLSVGDVLKGRRVISGKNFTSQTILVLEN